MQLLFLKLVLQKPHVVSRNIASFVHNVFKILLVLLGQKRLVEPLKKQRPALVEARVKVCHHRNLLPPQSFPQLFHLPLGHVGVILQQRKLNSIMISSSRGKYESAVI